MTYTPEFVGRFWVKVQSSNADECWPWTASVIGNAGYGKIKFKGRTLSAHRTAWELANGPIPRGMSVCHTCDNPLCCNPSHLFVGTQADNMHDKCRKGRARGQHQGEGNTHAKLTADDVRAIRARYADGEQQKAIAASFDINQATVSLIVHRRLWRHI